MVYVASHLNSRGCMTSRVFARQVVLAQLYSAQVVFRFLADGRIRGRVLNYDYDCLAMLHAEATYWYLYRCKHSTSHVCALASVYVAMFSP